MTFCFRKIALAIGTLGVLATAPAHAGVPYPSKETPHPLDLGAVANHPTAGLLSVTLPLKLADEKAATAFLEDLYKEGSPTFHQFLTPEQFKAKFAQSDADVAKVIAKLSAYGLTVERTGATTLRATGSAANLERAFQVSLHTYEVPAHGTTPSYRFQAPTHAPTVPAEVSSVVDSVIGLNTRPRFAPHSAKSFARAAPPQIQKPAQGSESVSTTDAPGVWTVADFEQYYDVLPLTSKGISGEGRTVGIVTLAAFTPSDAFAYWKSLGLNVNPNRLHVIDIDGGPGAPSDASGSIETSLDVEQSGGIAPGAEVVVYQAPNTSQGFVDAFVTAVEHNHADSISVSWGEWEWFDEIENAGPVLDAGGKTVSVLRAYKEIFLQAALQGQTMFAAAGDQGAYDPSEVGLPPNFTLALGVDSPAGDPYITAAGGTTLAGTQTFIVPGGTLAVTIPKERVWSWDYLVPLCTVLGYDPISCGIFPVGSGGGVSFEFDLPFYQRGIKGIQRTQPNQVLTELDVTPPQLVEAIPAYYPGRNVPDISANADPDTGYIIYYTSDTTGFAVEQFYGGTSFVAPQLNGVMGLIGQFLHGRVGLLNIPMYKMAQDSSSYYGRYAPFHVIKYGNNDFYTGRDGYSPAVGIGTLDVTNFAYALKYAHF